MKEILEEQLDILNKFGVINLYTIYKKICECNNISLDDIETIVDKRYIKLNKKFLDILIRENYIESINDTLKLKNITEVSQLNEIEKKLNNKEKNIFYYHYILMKTVFNDMYDILLGNKLATDVIFKNGNSDLVENIYKNNKVADILNDKVKKAIKTYIEINKNFLEKDEKIRILEIGSGTGGTSKDVLNEISNYKECIEYIYSDISQYFVNYGKKHYDFGKFVEFKKIDVEKPLIMQGIEKKSIDIVLGANVIHATANLSNVIENIKSVLKSDGWIVLNELTSDWDFAVYAFGLLDGWWLSEDDVIRIDKSPLLTTTMWNDLLKKKGFKNIIFDSFEDSYGQYRQSCIIAESDGCLDSKFDLKQLETINKDSNLDNYGDDVDYSNDIDYGNDVTDKIYSVFEKITCLSRDKLDGNISLWDFGIDSILLTQISAELNTIFNTNLNTSDFFKYTTINKIIDFVNTTVLKKKIKENNSIKDLSKNITKEDSTVRMKTDNSDIAVIGMSGRFPGAKNVDEFWSNISKGVISDNTGVKKRWPNIKNDIKAFLLEDIDKFDASFFNLSPIQAEVMDPRQRLVLEEAWNVIEDSGYSKEYMKGKNVGVYIGCEGESGYLENEFRDEASLNSHVFLGRSNSVLSSRIAYFMDLKGPCLTIDTACSSSLLAIHEACIGIHNGDCDMAIAGGVQLIIKRENLMILDKMGMISKTGECRAFDNLADGFVPGEAVGMIMLKKLNKAIEDKDNIYGIIKGSLANQDGQSNGITAPNETAQTNLIKKFHEKYNVDPSTIDFVETHGTGTRLGDPVEVKALIKAFKYKTSKVNYCALGSVKANIGHAGAASGVCSVIKSLLCLNNNILPKQCNFENLNDEIDLTNSPFYIVKDSYKVMGKSLKRAAISSFGHSGTNVHLLLESYSKKHSKSQKDSYPIIISNNNEECLKKQAYELAKYLENCNYELKDISYTLALGRTHFKYKIKFSVKTKEELCESLIKISNGEFLDNYINTEEFDWDSIYEGEDCNKVSLPHYFFNKKTYWNREVSKNEFYKLIEDKTYSIDDKNMRYKLELSKEDFYFKDHVLKNENILPGVAYLEISQKGLSKWKDTIVKRIEKIVFKSPIKYKENQEIYLSLTKKDKYYKFNISTKNLESGIISENVQGRLYTELENENTNEYLNIEEKLNDFKEEKDINEFYDKTKELGLNLGTSFRVINKIKTNNLYEVVTKISLPKDMEYQLKDIRLHTSLLDGALQGAFAAISKNLNELIIPFSIDEVLILSELEKECYVYINVRDIEKKKFDVFIVNYEGKILIKLKGLLARKYFEVNKSKNNNVKKSDLYFIQEKLINVNENFSSKFKKENIILYSSNTMKLNIFKELDNKLKDSKLIEVNMNEEYSKLIEKFKVIFKGYNKSINIINLLQYTNTKNLVKVTYSIINAIYETGKNRDISIKQFIIENSVNNYVMRGISGLFNTIKKECKSIDSKIIILKDNNYNLDSVLKDISSKGLDNGYQVTYINDKRMVRQYETVKIDLNINSNYLGKNILITGGLGGVGYEISKLLVNKYNSNLILVGRHKFDDVIKEKIRGISNSKDNVYYFSCDITKKEDILSLNSFLDDNNLKINGIFHCAGILNDSLFINKDINKSQKVIDTKIKGIELIDKNIDLTYLDYCILFSSLTSVVGNIGQSDYGYANSLLDNYSIYRKESNCPGKTISIGWPMIDSKGMQLIGKEDSYVANISGMKAMSTNEILLVIEKLLANGDKSNISVFKGDLDIMNRYVNSEISTNAEVENIEYVIKDSIAKVMKLNIDEIDLDKKFSEYGFDSITFTEVSNILLDDFEIDVSPAIFFEYPIISEFIQYLKNKNIKDNNYNNLYCEFNLKTIDKNELLLEDGEVEENLEVEEFLTDKKVENECSHLNLIENEPIAIVGMSGIFPDADNIEQYWENIKNGKCSIKEIPEDRWNWREYYGDPLKEKNKSNNIWGGFINNFDCYDSKFFKVSPKEANLMDPQQRLFMQVTWNLFEDAGYKIKDVREKNIGVFVGVSGFDYNQLLIENNVDIDSYTSIGNSHAMIANKVSYLFNLHGPSEAMDTACSSSLACVNRAIKAIRNGECDSAIVGGVNIILSPMVHISFSKAGLLSKDGHCNVFDENANGYVRGEGVGAILIKPLSKAIKDGDNIYALIRGSAENHNGNTNTITSPNANAQSDVILKACKDAGINFDTISYIECHGTGTRLGDTVEVSGLVKAFNNSRASVDSDKYCAIGSVKANIGHLESAAGIAGIIKVVLALKNKIIPKNVNFNNINELININNTNFEILKENKYWKPIKYNENILPRRAGISSFGFGGSNAHIILEEYTSNNIEASGNNNEKELIILSAKSTDVLDEYCKNLLNFIDNKKLEVNEDNNKCIEDFINIISNELKIDRYSISRKDTLEELGVDAISYNRLMNKLKEKYIIRNEIFNYSCTIEELFNSNTMIINKYREGINLEDISYTLQNGREEFQYRLAFIATNIEDMSVKLKNYLNGKNDDIFIGNCTGINLLEYFDKEDLDTFVNTLANNKEYEKLAKLWVKGINVDWKQIHNGGKKMSLPVYPFKKERHWFKKNNSKTQHLNVIGPMIENFDFEKSINENKFVYKKHFSIKDPILRDHTINGVSVLPGVGQLECICEACNTIFKNKKIKVKINWLNPIIVKYEKDIEVHLVKDNNKVIATLVSFENEEVIHSKAIIELEKSSAPQKLDIEKILAMSTKKIDGDSFYEAFRKTSVTHGLYCMSLKELDVCSNDICVGKVSLPQELLNEFGEFILHPTIMDGVLQVTAGVTKEMFGENLKPKVPFSIDELSVFDTIPTTVYSLVKRVGNDRFDITVTDESGNVVILIKSMSSRLLKKKKSLKTYGVDLEKCEPINNNVMLNEQTLIIYNEFNNLIKDLTNQYKNNILVDLNSNDYIDWIKIIKNNNFKFKNIYYILLDKNRVNGEKIIFNFFRLIKSLIDIGYENENINIKVITGSIFSNEYINRIPYEALVQGLIKSISKEYKKWSIQGFNIENYSSIEPVINNYNLEGKDLIIKNNECYTTKLIKADLENKNNTGFKEKGCYLIIGGANGIGFELAKLLSSKYEAKVILVGRRKINEEIANKISLINDMKGTAVYYSCDISNEDSIKMLKNELREENINGIIHSAIVLKDKTIRFENEMSFKEVLKPKVEGSVLLYEFFKDFNLDFILFFSSFQSFSGSFGQGNYAAASLFEDAFARYLANNNVNAKVINWGYWGEVGVVSSEKYSSSLKKQGMYSIDIDEGLEVIENFLKDDKVQLIAMNCDEKVVIDYNKRVLKSIDIDKEYEKINEIAEIGLAYIINKLDVDKKLLKEGNLVLEDIFNKNKIDKKYIKLINELVLYCNKNNKKIYELTKIVKTDFDTMINKINEIIQEYPDLNEYAHLIEICSKSYMDILLNNCTATSIIFPKSSMVNVENIYSNNNIANYYNNLVCEQMNSYLEEHKNKKISILEIGAGTGGTTKHVLKAIKEGNNLDRVEYHYSDLSQSFLMFAKKRFEEYSSIMKYEILNIEDIESKFEEFDIVIATNVLHATSNIMNTINNINTLLHKKGVLIINETMNKNLFLTIVFGLLDGWWESNDNYRLEGSPLISYREWIKLLESSGFTLKNPQNIYKSNQNVICALKIDKKITSINENMAIQEMDITKSNIENELKKIFCKQLEMNEIDENASFMDYGVDSIVSLELIEKINEKLHLELSSTILFDYSNILELSEYISSISTMINNEDKSKAEDVDIVINTQKDIDILKKEINNIICNVMERTVLLDENESFADNGIDSISGLEVINKLNLKLGLNLRSTILFEYNNICELAEYINEINTNKKIDFKEEVIDNCIHEELNNERGEEVIWENTNTDIISDKVDLDDILRKLEEGEIPLDEACKIMEGYYAEDL